MILPTTLLFGALGYIFYTSKKELSIDDDDSLGNAKENDDLYKDLEDLFIWFIDTENINTEKLYFLTKDIQKLNHS